MLRLRPDELINVKCKPGLYALKKKKKTTLLNK